MNHYTAGRLRYFTWMRTGIVAAIAAASLAAGCESVVARDSSMSVIVYGRVSAAHRPEPLPALMSISAHGNGSCDGPFVASANTVTTASGEYRLVLITFGERLSTCVRVTAQPPEASGFAIASEQRAPVEMRSSRPDSIQVDLVLQPAN